MQEVRLHLLIPHPPPAAIRYSLDGGHRVLFNYAPQRDVAFGEAGALHFAIQRALEMVRQRGGQAGKEINIHRRVNDVSV